MLQWSRSRPDYYRLTLRHLQPVPQQRDGNQMKVHWRSPKSLRDYEQTLTTPIAPRSVQEVRRSVRIVVVDDRDFAPLRNLQQNQFDITRLHDVETTELIQAYPVVLVDLQGVGTSMNPTLQGAHVIREIKAHYPEKYVIAYSGGAEPQLVAPAVETADKYTQKDTSIKDWCEILDEATRDVADPTRFWRKTRYRLLDEGATPYEVACLEDSFVRALLDNPSDAHSRLLATAKKLNISPNVKSIINSLAASTIFSLFA